MAREECYTAILVRREGTSTQYFRTLIPDAMKSVVLKPETSSLEYVDPLAGIFVESFTTRKQCRTTSQQHTCDIFDLITTNV